MSSTAALPAGHHIIVHPDLQEPVTPQWFMPEHWQQLNAVHGSATGRGAALFIQYNGIEMVLRHYRRGGLIGKLIHVHYLYTGLPGTRAWQEFTLLMYMRKHGLAVPEPIAAQVIRHGLTYRADLITRRIEDAKDVFTLLLDTTLSERNWQDIGNTIRAMHDLQVYHHDLNIHNIMCDKHNKVWLIDFDKCAIRSGHAWKQKNLDRLLRSLRKEQGKHSAFQFSEQDWQQLLVGYQRT
ncbi:3-deoxy-D-manno-octulosonic acid kinase [Aestuariibacter salexigens]|uniref:3-deoxy-D-manno-octulosonic acid kinase n=1 Tax=Aestuariibacter salexigens TaxID=226010 RepID=UPI0003FE383C|nr:3-deoxy-D-manno-octulosonic acid kinase [Aestuariibacter salexigens]